MYIIVLSCKHGLKYKIQKVSMSTNVYTQYGSSLYIKGTKSATFCSYFKDFDLAAGRVQMLRVLSCFILFECVNLDAKWDPLLTTMLTHCELCADAMNLTTIKQLFTTTICTDRVFYICSGTRH